MPRPKKDIHVILYNYRISYEGTDTYPVLVTTDKSQAEKFLEEKSKGKSKHDDEYPTKRHNPNCDEEFYTWEVWGDGYEVNH